MTTDKVLYFQTIS